MKCDRGGVEAFLFVVLFSFYGGLAVAEPPPASPGSAAERPSLVILELAQSGGELPPAQREAVEEAILSMSRAADLVLCLEGRPSIEDMALEALCSRPDRNLPRLWWKAQVAVPRQRDLDFLRLSLELEAGRKAPTGPAQLIVLSQTPLPAAENPDLVLAKEIVTSLAALPDLQGWFVALRQRSDLLRSWPSEKDEAASAAALPPASAEGAAAEVGTPAKAPGAKKKIEIEGEKSESPKTSSSSVFFSVREALIGGGFQQGVSGSLRVSSTGIGFTPKGKDREEWSIPWRDLADVTKDAGVWDISHPLVVVDRKGQKRYIARLDEKGNYLPGDSILAAIRQKRATPKETSDQSL